MRSRTRAAAAPRVVLLRAVPLRAVRNPAAESSRVAGPRPQADRGWPAGLHQRVAQHLTREASQRATPKRLVVAEPAAARLQRVARA